MAFLLYANIFFEGAHMSRIGKKPIALPAGVQIRSENDVLTVKGPLGELQRTLHPAVGVEFTDKELSITPKDLKDPSAKPLWGLYRSLVNNMVTGVTKGFSKTLEVVGTGWKFEMRDPKTIQLYLGFSHELLFPLPEGVKAELGADKGRGGSDKPPTSSLRITLSSINNELLGQVCATIRAYRPPEPYKGKGVKYQGEVIRRKAGKAGNK
jgi:large subunit ribosomal protein L6